MGQLTTVQIQGLINTGTVEMTSAPDVFICDVDNSGSVTATNSNAVLVGITNTGDVTASGGSFAFTNPANSEVIELAAAIEAADKREAEL